MCATRPEACLLRRLGDQRPWRAWLVRMPDSRDARSDAFERRPSHFLSVLTPALTCCRKPQRGTSGGCRQSGAALC